MLRKLLALAASATIALVALGAVAAPASASTYTSYVVLDAKRISTTYTGSEIIGSCNATSPGGTCTISSGMSATRTVQLQWNATYKQVTAGLSISNAKTVTVSTSCTSPKMSAGQTWKAKPVGDRYSYKLKRISNGGLSQTTSGTLYAFDPKPTKISCGF